MKKVIGKNVYPIKDTLRLNLKEVETYEEDGKVFATILFDNKGPQIKSFSYLISLFDENGTYLSTIKNSVVIDTLKGLEPLTVELPSDFGAGVFLLRSVSFFSGTSWVGEIPTDFATYKVVQKEVSAYYAVMNNGQRPTPVRPPKPNGYSKNS